MFECWVIVRSGYSSILLLNMYMIAYHFYRIDARSYLHVDYNISNRRIYFLIIIYFIKDYLIPNTKTTTIWIKWINMNYWKISPFVSPIGLIIGKLRCFLQKHLMNTSISLKNCYPPERLTNLGSII